MANFGELLRQARDFKGVTLREAERSTRISRNYLAALESEDFAQLPAATYARGIVRNYAQFLGLDPSVTITKYDELTSAKPQPIELVPATRPLDVSSHWAPNFAIIAFMIVMSLVVFTWMYSAYFREAGSIATSTVGVPTVTPVSASILAAVTVQPTVPTQGGGFATTTPPPSPTATVAAPPTATTPAETPAPTAVPTEPAPVEVADEPVEEPADEPTVASEGAHTFVVWALEEVWVQVTLNDGASVAFDGTMAAGEELTFYGDSVAITSGNASFVNVYVDGEDYGMLGDAWDATFYYP
jgi:cytoskeletal protein RodZ